MSTDQPRAAPSRSRRSCSPAAALAPVGVPSPAGALVGGTEVPVAALPVRRHATGPAAGADPGPLHGHRHGARRSSSLPPTVPSHVRPGFVHVHVGGQSYSVHAKELHPRWNGDPADGHDLALLAVEPASGRSPSRR